MTWAGTQARFSRPSIRLALRASGGPHARIGRKPAEYFPCQRARGRKRKPPIGPEISPV